MKQTNKYIQFISYIVIFIITTYFSYVRLLPNSMFCIGSKCIIYEYGNYDYHLLLIPLTFLLLAIHILLQLLKIKYIKTYEIFVSVYLILFSLVFVYYGFIERSLYNLFWVIYINILFFKDLISKVLRTLNINR